MIEINLVPENLRKKRKHILLGGENVFLRKEIVVGVIVGIIALLLCLHVVLQLLVGLQFAQHQKYKEQLERLGSNKTTSDEVISNLRELQSKEKDTKKIIGDQDILWSQNLEEISNSLTKGVWLDRIVWDKDVLLIHGSAVSKEKSAMSYVHDFISNLKKNDEFAAHFSGIELELIKTRKIGSTQVADFSIVADFEKKEEDQPGEKKE